MKLLPNLKKINDMDNLMNMLTKKPIATAQPAQSLPQPLKPLQPIKPPEPIQPPTQSDDNEAQICVKLPERFVEYIRDFQHHEAMKTGNLHFSFKDAIISIIAHHQTKNPEVSPRPEIVKQAEKKTGRKVKSENVSSTGKRLIPLLS